MKKKIAFVINPKSGTGNKNEIPILIDKHLDKTMFDYTVRFTEYRGHGKELAAQFVALSYDAVVAVGGDGTVNEVASALIHTSVSLGIIPVGSGNGLARHLGIPVVVKNAIQHLNRSESILMDYGLVNNQPFFCTCGTGFDAYVSIEFAKSKHRGVMSYLEKMITGIFNYKPIKYHLLTENSDLEGKAFVLTFANASQFGNNAFIAPQASVQDGKLDVSILSDVPFIALPGLALQLFTKTIDKDFNMTTLRSESFTLLRDEPGPFHFDGEPYQEGKRIEIKIVADGLRVLVKKRF